MAVAMAPLLFRATVAIRSLFFSLPLVVNSVPAKAKVLAYVLVWLLAVTVNERWLTLKFPATYVML